MAQTPSPLLPRNLNCITPTTVERKIKNKVVESQTYSIYQDAENFREIPFNDHDDGSFDLDMSISTSPFKNDEQPFDSPAPSIATSLKSPRKLHSPSKKPVEPSTLLTEDSLRENEGLTRAIHMLENDRQEFIEHDTNNDTISTIDGPNGYPGMDDTNFTAFSAVLNADMTLFAQIGQPPSRSAFNSPAKSVKNAPYPHKTSTPQRVANTMPASVRRNSFDECTPSPTPRRQKPNQDEDTNLILDFTEQFSAFARSSSRSPNRNSRPSPKKSQTQPNLASYISDCRTPSPNKRQTVLSGNRYHPNLLDFDLPPAPTPRSIPSITARELESLKSSFLSQISSLRATLSGKEAEVNSLKDAVTDAERRVGEALEEIREERGTKENLQAEKIEWERRDKEMQMVLRNVKEVNIQVDRERDQLQQKLDESEHRREEADTKVIEAQSRIAGLEASASAVTNSDGTPDAKKASGNVEAAVEKVAKELHGLYRQKHEVKVAALKESYRARWERKVRELETKIEDLGRENEELRLGRDATMSSVLPGTVPTPIEPSETQTKPRPADPQRIEQADAQLAEIGAALSDAQHHNASLLTQLERERRAMADLVAATEEMMQLSLQPPLVDGSQPASTIENLKGSVSRAAGGGLKVPGESRIGRMAGGGRGGVGGVGGVGGMKSGIMGSIERMGRRAGD